MRVTRWAVVVLTSALALGIASCSSNAPLSPSEAQTRYDRAVDSVTRALTTKYGVAWHETSASTVSSSSSACTYYTKTMSADSVISTPPRWPEVMDVVNAALESQGFDKVTTEASIPGGWTGIDVTDDKGATVRIETSDVTRVRAWVKVSGSC